MGHDTLQTLIKSYLQAVHDYASAPNVKKRNLPNQVSRWKHQALESLADIFSGRRARQAQDEAALKAQLYQQIGYLKVELDWLNKSWIAQLSASAR